MNESHGISRRDVLRGLGAGAALTLSGSRFARAATSPRVVIVGAGLSGLAAADALRLADVDVRVLEASGRAGGRIETLRAPFADGLDAEAGGDAIGSSYHTLFGLVRDLGLSLVPGEGAAARQRGDVLLDLGGHPQRLSDLRRNPDLWTADGWGTGWTEVEKAAAPFGLLGLYLGPLAREIGDPAKILEPRWLEYDRLSLEDLLIERGASAPARRMINHVLNANSSKTLSALSMLRELARRFAGGSGTFRIAGGNDLLPRAMAARLGRHIHYGVQLKQIAWSHDGPSTLTVESQGRQEIVQADAVILTLPFTALRLVTFTPALPETKATMIAELPYTSIVKVYVQTRRRFWRDDSGLAAVVSDRLHERLFDYGAASATGRALLLSWINGTGTDRLPRDPNALGQGVLEHLARLFPTQRELLESTTVVDWRKRYSQGAYSHFAPGQMSAWANEAARPLGGLFFAGEHTEVVKPGMEGALISGQRAAREVLIRHRSGFGRQVG